MSSGGGGERPPPVAPAVIAMAISAADKSMSRHCMGWLPPDRRRGGVKHEVTTRVRWHNRITPRARRSGRANQSVRGRLSYANAPVGHFVHDEPAPTIIMQIVAEARKGPRGWRRVASVHRTGAVLGMSSGHSGICPIARCRCRLLPLLLLLLMLLKYTLCHSVGSHFGSRSRRTPIWWRAASSPRLSSPPARSVASSFQAPLLQLDGKLLERPERVRKFIPY